MGSQVYNSGSGLWTCPTGVTSITVRVWGAGGGGEHDPWPANFSHGGGGGGGAKKVFTVTPGNSYSYQVGAGGGQDLDGGDTWFLASDATGITGKGGQHNGTHGGGLYGDTNYNGADGTLGYYDDPNFTEYGGNGGDSASIDGVSGLHGYGGSAYDGGVSVATVGQAPGGGGGGGALWSALYQTPGVAGANGRIVIEWTVGVDTTPFFMVM